MLRIILKIYITRHVSPYLSKASSGLSLSLYVKHTPTHTGTDLFLLRCSVFACHLIGMVQTAIFFKRILKILKNFYKNYR
jgi:hypothetical protein